MTYQEHHQALVTYLMAKVDMADWHGVSDAACDLRVLEAEYNASQKHLVETPCNP